jgi:hypothetical protein
MTSRALVAFFLFVLCPLGIATGILAAFTVGESLDPRNSGAIGFAVALLVVMTAAYLLVFAQMTEKPGSRLGQTLVICGTMCMLMAVALQFYLASVTAENARRLAEILSESVRNGRPRTNVNIQGDLPRSIQGIGYLALFAGVWLAAVGIRLGVGNAEKASKHVAEERFASSPEAQGAFASGIRQGSG